MAAPLAEEEALAVSPSEEGLAVSSAEVVPSVSSSLEVSWLVTMVVAGTVVEGREDVASAETADVMALDPLALAPGVAEGLSLSVSSSSSLLSLPLSAEPVGAEDAVVDGIIAATPFEPRIDSGNYCSRRLLYSSVGKSPKALFNKSIASFHDPSWL